MTHECTLFDKEIDFSNISIVQGLMLGILLFDRKN